MRPFPDSIKESKVKRKKIRLLCSWIFFFLTVLIINFKNSGFGKTGNLLFSSLALDLNLPY